MGLSPTHGEPCMYQAHRGENVLLLLIYVDDILVASQSEEWMREVKRSLMEEFEIKDLGVAKYCLGLEISQEEDTILLTQKGYTLGVLARWNGELQSHLNILGTALKGRAGDSSEFGGWDLAV